MMMGLSCITADLPCVWPAFIAIRGLWEFSSTWKAFSPYHRDHQSDLILSYDYYSFHRNLCNILPRVQNSGINSKSLTLMCLGIRPNFCKKIKWESFQIFNLVYSLIKRHFFGDSRETMTNKKDSANFSNKVASIFLQMFMGIFENLQDTRGASHAIMKYRLSLHEHFFVCGISFLRKTVLLSFH